MSEFSADSFIEKSLRGEVMLDEIDEYVEKWHRSSIAEPIASFLGMTDEEYSLWVRDPESLRYIVAARHEGTPLVDIIRDNYYSDLRLAARSNNSLEIKRIRAWLQKHDKVG